MVNGFDITATGDVKNMTLLSAVVESSTVVLDHINVDLTQDTFSGVKSKSAGLLINQSSKSILVLSDVVFTKFPQAEAEQ